VVLFYQINGDGDQLVVT